MAQLQRAVKDPTLKDTPVGRATAAYLDLRAQAQASAEAAGLAGFGTAKAARPLREWLRSASDQIVSDYPDFAQVFDLVFSREMKDPADEEDREAA